MKFPVSNTCVASVATPIQQGPLVLIYRKEIPDEKTCTGQVLELVPHENNKKIMTPDATDRQKRRIRPRMPRSLSAGVEALKQCRKIPANKMGQPDLSKHFQRSHTVYMLIWFTGNLPSRHAKS